MLRLCQRCDVQDSRFGELLKSFMNKDVEVDEDNFGEEDGDVSWDKCS